MVDTEAGFLAGNPVSVDGVGGVEGGGVVAPFLVIVVFVVVVLLISLEDGSDTINPSTMHRVASLHAWRTILGKVLASSDMCSVRLLSFEKSKQKSHQCEVTILFSGKQNSSFQQNSICSLIIWYTHNSTMKLVGRTQHKLLVSIHQPMVMPSLRRGSCKVVDEYVAHSQLLAHRVTSAPWELPWAARCCLLRYCCLACCSPLP